MIKIKVVDIPDDAGETLEMAEMGNGYIQPSFGQDTAYLQKVADHMAEMEIRTDDLLLATYSKTGTVCIHL